MRFLFLVIYLLLILLWAVISLIVMGVATLLSLPFDKERKMVLALSRVVARVVYIASPLWSVRVEGEENVDPTKRYVITSNHQSFFDIPLLFFLPIWKFKFVSKIEVRKIPAIGWMLGMRGDIVIRRGTASAATTLMEEGSEHLQAGTSVAIFPEGTRTRDGEIHRFKEGAFRLAQENGVAVLPCVIDDTKKLFTARGLNPRKLVVKILPAISEQEVQQTPTKELAKRVEEMTRTTLAEIRGVGK
ncbi:MAG: 1-acyl-sn-glycerol-3-phosphate acyltransferase [Tidjanibacter sp.]|nr:1-acyl-sn-glycerol-3-phosphate acyltransferase [Tidjanibacter sp.]